MLVEITNPLKSIKEITTVNSAANAGATEVSVLNNNGIVANDFIIIGKVGAEQTELRKVSAVTGSGAVTLTSALSFSHGLGTDIGVILYNQVEVSRKTSESGTFSVQDTIDLQVDQLETIYDDTTGATTSFYRIRFKNENSGQFSSYSATLKGTGYSTRAVKTIIKTVLNRTNDDTADFTTRQEVLQDVNYAYQLLINAIMQSSSEYYLKRVEIPTENFKHEYTLADDFREVQELRNGDQQLVLPAPREVIGAGAEGYELTGRNIIYFNSVPEPETNDTTTSVTVLANNAYDTDGSWVASLDATSVTTDTDEFKVGTGSVNFDVDVSADTGNVAAITNSTFTAQDLDAYEDTGKWRVWMYLPDVTYISSIAMRWGTSATVYWSLSVTSDYKLHAFKDGWNLVQFDWSSSDVSETGSPVTATATSLNYLQLRITYTADQPDDTDFRIDAVRLADTWDSNSVYEVSYLAQPAQLTNEMDEIELPEGNQSLLVDYAVAQILMRQGERDTLSNRLLNNFDKAIAKFISQSAKRTRRMVGMRPLGRPRRYGRASNTNSKVFHSDGNFTSLK